jgi:3-hydroxy-9,10-secoandrosta-1,3,5(10)-triene-9,17-dione monooxygenase
MPNENTPSGNIGPAAGTATRRVHSILRHNATFPMLTGGVGQDIRVEAADGGIVLSGRWRYASGVDISDWLGLLVNIRDSAGAPAPHIVLVAQPEFVVDHQSWRVIGMRGTGSKNIALDVPSSRLTAS